MPSFQFGWELCANKTKNERILFISIPPAFAKRAEDEHVNFFSEKESMFSKWKTPTQWLLSWTMRWYYTEPCCNTRPTHPDILQWDQWPRFYISQFMGHSLSQRSSPWTRYNSHPRGREWAHNSACYNTGPYWTT